MLFETKLDGKKKGEKGHKRGNKTNERTNINCAINSFCFKESLHIFTRPIIKVHYLLWNNTL